MKNPKFRLLLALSCLYYALPMAAVVGIGGVGVAVYQLNIENFTASFPFFACTLIWLLFTIDAIKDLRRK